ncbi:MAG: fumarylacetoacetate hydrolase family protein [Pseudonocardia sp.]
MKLARLGPRGHEIPALVTDAAVLDLRAVTPDIDPAFLAADGPARVRAAHEAGSLPELSGAAGLRIGAPVARPGAVLCIGMNYAAHAAESGSAPPQRPVLFFKSPSCLAGPDDPVTIPPGAQKVDWEVELGVVIGRRASYLGADEDPLAFVAGYVLADDLSERAYQLEHSGGQWSKGKCAPGFGPLGPWLVTADALDPAGLRLRSWVNGEPRQDSSTKDMIFDVAALVRDLSQYLALEPGDVVLTGTPEGVALSGRFPYLRPGDVVEVEIDGLGRQRHELVAAP